MNNIVSIEFSDAGISRRSLQLLCGRQDVPVGRIRSAVGPWRGIVDPLWRRQPAAAVARNSWRPPADFCARQSNPKPCSVNARRHWNRNEAGPGST